MIDNVRARERAEVLAKRYCKGLVAGDTSRLISQLEERAYGLAREGETELATMLFIAVADLSGADSSGLVGST